MREKLGMTQGQNINKQLCRDLRDRVNLKANKGQCVLQKS